MLVKVKDTYPGVFGHYVEKYHSVEPKRAGDAPFDVPEDVAKKQIANNVLEVVDLIPDIPMDIPEEAPYDIPEEKIAPVQKTLDEMNYSELKEEAKARGIAFVRINAKKLRSLIEEYDSENTPSFEAEDPV